MWKLLVLLALLLVSSTSAQPGFFSLDCGGKDNYSLGGVQWTSDEDFISTGLIASAEDYAARPYKSLRYFPDITRKHCYVIPVVHNRTYAVKLSFMYGNYDGLDHPPRFDYQVGSILQSVIADILIEDVKVRTTSDILNVCLGSTSAKNIPFLTTLEARLMGPGMYQAATPTQGMKQELTLNVGSTEYVEYPEDPYDRFWQADIRTDNLSLFSTGYPIISTNLTISPGITPEQPPSAVMQTAITSNSTMTWKYPFNLLPGDSEYYVTFFFAELLPLNTSEPRIFDIWTNETSGLSLFYGPIHMNKSRAIEFYAKNQVLTDPAGAFFFVPTNDSVRGPILNAAEFHLMLDLSPETEAGDVSAVNAIKAYFNLKDWSGDPCLPDRYRWSWVYCGEQKGKLRVTELKLSNMQLNGSIPNLLNNLTAVTKIYLNNNNLKGSIPDLSSLKALTDLDLQNNSLSGSIPSSLTTLPALSSVSLQNNKLNGCNITSSAIRVTGNPCTMNHGIKKKKPQLLVIVISAAAAGAVLIFIAVLAIFCCKKAASKTFSSVSSARELPSNEPNIFKYEDIITATKNFQSKRLGEGGFGPVYYGKLTDGRELAIKVHTGHSSFALQQFKNELDLLSTVHHRNLVSFVGYCTHELQLILVYEFMPNGTLREQLQSGCLTWKQRLNIVLGAAEGLEYLHSGCNPHIIHRDVKTSNILLNGSLVAKVADFGISLLCAEGATHMTTMVKGTIGYLDPEYHQTMRLTEKSDVYSFGVVILEIISGRLPIDNNLPEDQISLITWARYELEKNNLEAVVDPAIRNKYNIQAMWRVAELALACLAMRSVDRPSANVLVEELNAAIQIEERS